jgi:hypothetical protein
MKRNRQRKGITSSRYAGRVRPSMAMPKKTGKAMYGFDDFLSRLAALKEQGKLVISGMRIC